MSYTPQLKPACVELSQITLKYNGQFADAQDVIQGLTNVYESLRAVNALGPKLADYVFFPLSHVFRHSPSMPSKATNLALSCLNILIRHGWREETRQNLVKQILLLLGQLAGGFGKTGKMTTVSEETDICVLQCYSGLFQNSCGTISAFCNSQESESISVTGHTISIILSSMSESLSTDVRLIATEALQGLVSSVSDVELLRSFLPGILSQLTKILRPRPNIRQSYKVVYMGIQITTELLRKVLSDEASFGTLVAGSQESASVKSERVKPTEAWLMSTSSQLGLVLVNLLPLQYHEREEVVTAFSKLCIMLLRDCQSILRKSTGLVVQTLLSVCTYDFTDNGINSPQVLLDLMKVNNDVPANLQAILHDHISALPRVMQINDAAKRKRHVSQIRLALEACHSFDFDTEIVEGTLISALQQSVVAVLDSCSSRNTNPVQDEIADMDDSLKHASGLQSMTLFKPLPMTGKIQDDCLPDLDGLIEALHAVDSTRLLRYKLVRDIVHVSGKEQMACLWLSSRLLHSSVENLGAMEDLLQGRAILEPSDADFLDVIYSYSIDVLTRPELDDITDWRSQAIAMEVIAMQSFVQKLAFRTELVESLFPIVQGLASSNHALRGHATVCLNVLSNSCGYPSPSDLVIDNVDYLVNAITLRFNTFIINLKTPQVLSMMITLCGHELIPKLDDLIESIFSMLANFHGYSSVVTSLFSVLSKLVQRSQQKSNLALEQAIPKLPLVKSSMSTSVPDVVRLLSRLSALSTTEDTIQPKDLGPNALASVPSTVVGDRTTRDNDEILKSSPAVEDEALVNTPRQTYRMVQSIVRLSQYYLTHESPSLRQHLLELISMGCITLATNEDEFLPVINDIWPGVMQRLYDPEVFVSISAMKAVSRIFQHAGFFVASRVHSEWHNLRALYHRNQPRSTSTDSRSSGFNQFSTVRFWHENFVLMLAELIKHVPIDAELEDDLVQILTRATSSQGSHEGLAALNPDAVWLERLGGGCLTLTLPVCQGYIFRNLTAPDQ